MCCHRRPRTDDPNPLALDRRQGHLCAWMAAVVLGRCLWLANPVRCGSSARPERGTASAAENVAGLVDTPPRAGPGHTGSTERRIDGDPLGTAFGSVSADAGIGADPQHPVRGVARRFDDLGLRHAEPKPRQRSRGPTGSWLRRARPAPAGSPRGPTAMPRSMPVVGGGQTPSFDLGRAPQIAPRSDIRSRGRAKHAGSAFTPLNPRNSVYHRVVSANDEPEAVPGATHAGGICPSVNGSRKLTHIRHLKTDPPLAG
jgi:hypothetical protein